MTQLTIKHLGRRIQHKPKLVNTLTGKIGTLSNIYNIGEGYENDDIKLSIDYADGEHIWMFKPILRPLSDLTKEITHNGEIFVPIERIYNVEEMDLMHQYFLSENPIYRECIVKHNAIVKLIEWHFHIDEPEGTWIDVNTLPENPYK